MAKVHAEENEKTDRQLIDEIDDIIFKDSLNKEDHMMMTALEMNLPIHDDEDEFIE